MIEQPPPQWKTKVWLNKRTQAQKGMGFFPCLFCSVRFIATADSKKNSQISLTNRFLCAIIRKILLENGDYHNDAVYGKLIRFIMHYLVVMWR